MDTNYTSLLRQTVKDSTDNEKLYTYVANFEFFNQDTNRRTALQRVLRMLRDDYGFDFDVKLNATTEKLEALFANLQAMAKGQQAGDEFEQAITKAADIDDEAEAEESFFTPEAIADAAVWERVAHENPNLGALVVAFLYVEFAAAFSTYVKPHVDTIIKGATQYVLAHEGFKAALRYIKSFKGQS